MSLAAVAERRLRTEPSDAIGLPATSSPVVKSRESPGRKKAVTVCTPGTSHEKG
jgi:hypothetical protein